MKTKEISILRSVSLIVGLSILITLIFSGCNKDDENPAGPAPNLPPESSFVMDFSDFTISDTTNVYKNSLGYQNWGYAATNVFVWNTIITITFAVPVAAFYESFHHEGVWDPDVNAWVWSYNFVAVGVTHLAQLQGSLVNGGVKWEMYISKNNVYSDILWFWGITNGANTEAEWHLNANPQNLEEVIAIEWNRNIATGEANIKYTNVQEGAQEEGGYIIYGIANNEFYNAYYDIYSSSQDNLLEIQWHRINKNGRVKNELHFGDEDWRCWDENLLDIDCE
ncbi:MAG: hypothetical protein K8R74_10075 [Bacteroidales bacterium]|nr:hypothetical protein [Bacteroidales bacterium]